MTRRPDRTRPGPPIVYAYTQGLPNPAANSGAVLGLCEALAPEGDVAVVFPGGARDVPPVRRAYGLSTDVALSPVRPAPGPGFYPSLALAGLGAVRGAVIITRAPQAAMVSAALGRPTLLELHQHLDTFSNWKAWRRLLAAIPPGRLSVAALTSSLAAGLDPALAARALDVSVIPSGSPDFGGGSGSPSHDVGYVGSFKPGKGIEVVERLARHRPSLRFLIVGDPAGAPDTALRLSALPNVELSGFVVRADLAAQMRRFRIGLAPYAAEGFGGGRHAMVSSDSLSSMKIAEYMSAGCAVISSAIPSVAAMAAHGTEALLCRPDHDGDWLSALDRLATGEALRQRLAQAARRRFQAEFSMPARADRFRALARRLSEAEARP